MDRIIAQVQEWEYLSILPKEYFGFHLNVQFETKDQQYWIFSYENEGWHKRFSILYEKATKEFLARTVVGLTEYCDITFIASDKGVLEQLLKERMESTLKKLAVFDKGSIDSILLDKKVLEWEYGRNLPEEIAGFSLFIKPYEPFRVINGSYIILDYSDFLQESNLIIYYNMFRDEFFGEIRLHRTPQMTTSFDSQTLDELTVLMDTHLRSVLESMRDKLK